MISLIIFCVSYYLIAGISLTIGYHRCLSHRSFKLKKWFEYIIITLGIPAGTPIQWVGTHRYHHAHTDKNNDPHSPIIHGFWYAHNGWYIQTKNISICFLYAIAGPIRFIIDAWNRPRTNQEFNTLAKDIASDKYYKFLSKPIPYMIIVLLHLIFSFGFVFFVWQLQGILFLWITLVIIFNLGDGIDSISHLYGTQPYKNKSHAKNNVFLSILTLGDGWHANHHQFPQSAKLGFTKGQFDLSWKIICLLKKLKIASDIKFTQNEIVIKQLKEKIL